jgi:serine O-acetyltransferase
MALKIYRLGNWLWRHGIPILPWALKALNRIVFAVVIPPSASLGKGVLLSYEGLGTIIHKRAIVGDFVVISAGVVIGGRSGIKGVPVIHERAYIGAGAKILGDVTIGRGASIGANAVVLTDIPDYAVAVGAPAKVVKYNKPGEIPDYFSFRSEPRVADDI